MTQLNEYKGPLPTEEEAKRILSTHKPGDPLPVWVERYVHEVVLPKYDLLEKEFSWLFGNEN